MYGFTSARCQFLNYRRNMACYECEHERPPDEYTSNQMDSRQPAPTRTWRERGPPSRVPEVSDAWNFDFDDNESDGADVAAFEFADSSKGNLEEADLTGSRGRRSELHERKDDPYSSKTGFDDFDDEDDDLDNYEIDSSSRAGKDSGVARRSFSDFEESDVDDYENFNCSKKNSERRPRDSLNATDSDDEELINRANVRDKRGELKFDSDSDYDDDNDFRSNNAKRYPRASFSDSESDADDYRPSMEKHSKGGKFGSRSDFGRVRGTNRSGRDGTVHYQEDSVRKGSKFGSDGGYRGSQKNERSSRGGFDRRRDNVPGKSDESFRFNRRHQAGNNSFRDRRRDYVHGKPDQAGNRSFDRHRYDDFQNSDAVNRPRRVNVR